MMEISFLMVLDFVFAGLGLTGAYLNVKKNRFCFLFWMVSNLGYFFLGTYKGLYFQAIMFLVFFGVSVWGWFKWSKWEFEGSAKATTGYARMRRRWWR